MATNRDKIWGYLLPVVRCMRLWIDDNRPVGPNLSDFVARPFKGYKSHPDLTDRSTIPRWKQFYSSRSTSSEKRIMVISDTFRYDVESFAEYLKETVASVDLCSELDTALCVVENAPGKWRAVFVYLSDTSDIDNVVEELIEFRNAVPHIPVILVGPDFHRDDISTERAPIADITLREPIRLSWINQYLGIAEANNLLRQSTKPADSKRNLPKLSDKSVSP